MVQDGPKSRARGVAIHCEGLGEVRELEDWCGGQSRLQCFKGCIRCLFLAEYLFLEQLCQWSRDFAIGADELPVISSVAEEAPHHVDCAWLLPGLHHLHLLDVYGDALSRYDMAQVCHYRHVKRTLTLLHDMFQ
jgi:hypothetical protein